MVCGHTTLFLSTHFLFQHYLIASPTPSWMGTLWWPCSKGKSPSREPSSSTAARTQKWSASIALTASRRSSFCRYWQEAFPSLFSLSVLRLCLYHNAFFFFTQVLCVGNLYNPDVRYSFNIPIEEHREQFVWDPSGSWLECSRICQGKCSAKSLQHDNFCLVSVHLSKCYKCT